MRQTTEEILLIDAEKAELWKRRFFEAQASAEEFITEQYGDEGIDAWQMKNAAITARLLHAEMPDPGRKVAHFTTRLFNQLSIYDSRIIREAGESGTRIDNPECGILRYRGAAAQRGVKLTFKSPCDYCQKLNIAIYEAYTGAKNIECATKSDGCTWSIGEPAPSAASR